jgi:hypothetical protein
MIFYVGLDDLYHAHHFDHVFVSVNRFWKRRRQGKFMPRRFIMDSGAFTEVSAHGGYRSEPEAYADEVNRWANVPGFECAVSQDYMCEPFIVEKTGLSVQEHQRLTIDRFDRIRVASKVPIMPVLQGYKVAEYLEHLDAYGDRLHAGMRVGVGSVCKRNSSVAQIEDVLGAIHDAAPGLLLHGFGIKTTALSSCYVWDVLHSADSMAWSLHARKNGRSAHDWREAARFEAKIHRQPRQLRLC